MSDTCEWCVKTSALVDSIEYQNEQLQKENESLKQRVSELTEIVKAVAHIGIEFEDYGKFEIGEYHVQRARELLAEITPPEQPKAAGDNNEI